MTGSTPIAPQFATGRGINTDQIRFRPRVIDVDDEHAALPIVHERHGRHARSLLAIIAPRDRAIARVNREATTSRVEDQHVSLDQRRPREAIINIRVVVVGQVSLPTGITGLGVPASQLPVLAQRVHEAIVNGWRRARAGPLQNRFTWIQLLPDDSTIRGIETEYGVLLAIPPHRECSAVGHRDR